MSTTPRTDAFYKEGYATSRPAIKAFLIQLETELAACATRLAEVDKELVFEREIHKKEGEIVARAFKERDTLAADNARLKGLQRELFLECETAGWDPDKKNSFAEECTHLHEELSEAFREWRKFKNFDIRNDESGKPTGIPIEFADVIIGLFYNAELHGFDLFKAVRIKHEYNLRRSYKDEGRRLHNPAPENVPPVPASGKTICHDCEGAGQIQTGSKRRGGGRTCFTCAGTGFVTVPASGNEATSKGEPKVCDRCHWSNTELLNVGNPRDGLTEATSFWICHGCIKRQHDALVATEERLAAALRDRDELKRRVEEAEQLTDQIESEKAKLGDSLRAELTMLKAEIVRKDAELKEAVAIAHDISNTEDTLSRALKFMQMEPRLLAIAALSPTAPKEDGKA